METPKLSLALKSLFRADVLVMVKNRRSLVISALLPLLLLFATHTEKSQEKLGGDLFIVALSITLGFISNSILGYALTVARDRDAGIFQRLRVTPTPTWAIMFSRLLVQVIGNLIIAIVVLIVGRFYYHLSLTVGDYAAVLAASVLGSAVFLSIGQALVGLVKSSDSLNAVGRIVYMALVLLGLLGMSGVLGDTFQKISNWSPVGSVITVLLSAVHQTAWSSHTTYELLTCFGYIIVFTAIGIKWFQWSSQ